MSHFWPLEMVRLTYFLASLESRKHGPNLFSAKSLVNKVKLVNINCNSHLLAYKGAGIFVTTVVAGSILSFRRFQMMQRPVLRDIFFYTVASYLAWYIFWIGQINFFHAICNYIVIFYLFFALVLDSD